MVNPKAANICVDFIRPRFLRRHRRRAAMQPNCYLLRHLWAAV